jgi:hypothetical protein
LASTFELTDALPSYDALLGLHLIVPSAPLRWLLLFFDDKHLRKLLLNAHAEFR